MKTIELTVICELRWERFVAGCGFITLEMTKSKALKAKYKRWGNNVSMVKLRCSINSSVYGNNESQK